MNERIEQLAVQHGFVHEHMATGEKNDALNKFLRAAELIVREAIATVHEVGYKASNDIQPEVTQLSESQLKQRFGLDQ